MLTSVEAPVPDETPSPPESARRSAQRPAAGAAARRSRGARWAITLLCAAITLAVVRAVVVQSFVIPTGSMEPTLRVGDRVLVARYAYVFGGAPRRGDVVVFDGAGVFEPATPGARSPLASAGRSIASAFGLPAGGSDYVKRVIGVAGDRVVCCDAGGRITVNGTPITEPYVQAGDAPSDESFDVVVPPGRLWVMGDHRSDSADSRAHVDEATRGTVPVDRVVGRVIGVFWPMSHSGLLRHVSYGAIASGSKQPSSVEGTG